MQIVNTTVQSYEAGIELADLDSVKEAIRHFADGGTAGSRETTRLGFDNTIAGGYGVAFKMILDAQADSPFLARLLRQVDGVEDRGFFSASYDYDGPGPFFKTSVEVNKYKVSVKDVYTLQFNAAYVGDGPTAGLAQSLGADRALWRDEVVIQVAPRDQRTFAFDFDVVADKLQSIGLDTPSGQDMARHIMMQAEAMRNFEERFPPLFVRNDDITVSVGVVSYSVGRAVDFSSDSITWQWQQPTAVITGPLAEWSSDNDPRLYCSVSVPDKANATRWDRSPIFDPAIKQAIHEQASAISRAFA